MCVGVCVRVCVRACVCIVCVCVCAHLSSVHSKLLPMQQLSACRKGCFLFISGETVAMVMKDTTHTTPLGIDKLRLRR